MGIMGDGEETPLSAVRLCWMEVPPNDTLDMNGSLQLTIATYKGVNMENLESKSHSPLPKVRGQGLILNIVACIGLVFIMHAGDK